VVAAVNDDQLLASNLGKSPMLASGKIPLVVERGHDCAGKAYNAGMDRVDADVIIFAHQDVYFPRGWEDKLSRALASLHRHEQKWAILGVWGVRRDGCCGGRVWCTGGNCEYNVPLERPTEAASVDEVVLVFNRSSGLRFDEALPGFHMYATDMAYTARQSGMGTYIIDAPLVHNSHWDPQFDTGYFRAYRYMSRKWAASLPLMTCVQPIERWPWRIYLRWVKIEMMCRMSRVAQRPRHADPQALAHTLRYELD
jgi:hypothetical protein